MTSTVIRDDRMSPPPEGPSGPRSAPPPKLRRRPWVTIAAILAIGLGAFGGTWVWSASTDTVEVLAARTTIPRGSVITADDVERVRISSDPALTPLPGSAINQVVGRRAAYDILGGSLLTSKAATSDPVPPKGMSVVGVALTAAQAPGLQLRTGDPVRVVVTPAEGDDAPAGAPDFTTAEVVGSHTAEDGTVVVDVEVPYAAATFLAARAATGNVALVLDSGAK